MVQLQADLKDLEGSDRQVFVISQDSQAMSAKLAKSKRLDFRFLADPEMKASDAFGITFKIDDKTKAMYKNYNIDLEALYGRAKPLMTVPSIFLAKEGKVVFQYANPDYRNRMDPAVLKAAANAYLP